MKSISAIGLNQLILQKGPYQLIDVREALEHDDFNIGGDHIPMNEIFENIHRISQTLSVIFYCQKGIRSAIIIQRLEEKLGLTNLINLSGGMEAWKKAF